MATWNSAQPLRIGYDVIHKGQVVPAAVCSDAFLAGAADQMILTEAEQVRIGVQQTHGNVEQPAAPADDEAQDGATP